MEHMQAVEKMQDYIKHHAKDEDFELEQVWSTVGYSRRQADRLFRKYTGKTVYEYTKAVCLTQGAVDLADTKQSVLEIAFNSHFQSHEGFTRSFSRIFHVTPEEYREKRVPIPLFVQYPVSHARILLEHKEEAKMSCDLNLCMITAKERPARKFIYLPSRKAEDYLSYCEEMGCGWEGLLNSIPGKFDTAALVELPDFMVEEGFSKVAAGVEVPLEYENAVPQHYKVAELPPCTMLYFQSEPYEKAEEFGSAIGKVYAAIEKYNPAVYGYQFAYDVAPSFNFGADTATGARLAVPVVCIE